MNLYLAQFEQFEQFEQSVLPKLFVEPLHVHNCNYNYNSKAMHIKATRFFK